MLPIRVCEPTLARIPRAASSPDHHLAEPGEQLLQSLSLEVRALGAKRLPDQALPGLRISRNNTRLTEAELLNEEAPELTIGPGGDEFGLECDLEKHRSEELPRAFSKEALRPSPLELPVVGDRNRQDLGSELPRLDVENLNVARTHRHGSGR